MLWWIGQFASRRAWIAGTMRSAYAMSLESEKVRPENENQAMMMLVSRALETIRKQGRLHQNFQGYVERDDKPVFFEQCMHLTLRSLL